MRVTDSDEWLFDDMCRFCEASIKVAESPFGSELATYRLTARLDRVDSRLRPLNVTNFGTHDRCTLGTFFTCPDQHISLRVGIAAAWAKALERIYDEIAALEVDANLVDSRLGDLFRNRCNCKDWLAYVSYILGCQCWISRRSYRG